MKHLIACCLILSLCANVYLANSNLNLRSSNQVAWSINAIRQARTELLNDQLNDCMMKFSSTKTYEQGLNDGILRSMNSGYVDGYHAAIGQSLEDVVAIKQSFENGAKSPEMKPAVAD